MGTTYKQAGVDIDANDTFVDAILPAIEGTHGPDVIPVPAGFAGEIALWPRQALFAKRYKDPVLAACTDGVGTKLKIAFLTGVHGTIGTDLVAMSVNDLITSGSRPLFFLDYIAFSGVPNEVQIEVVKGIAKACRECGCALLGGERAELPGFYKKGEYDLAGFAVGVIERSKRIDGSKVVPGDAVIGIASSGLHSNGYSLARKVLLEDAKLKVDQHIDELGCTLGEELLRPTLIYSNAIHALIKHYKKKAGVKAIAHITGAGIPGNLPRVLPKNCSARISKSAWPKPPIFGLIQKLGDVAELEMYDVFNMGIGMILVVPPTYAQSIVDQLQRQRHKAYVIGRIKRGPNKVELVD